MADLYVRYEHEGATSFGNLEGAEIHELNGDIFGDRSLSGKTVALDDVKLRYPVEAEKVLAVGLNYASHLGSRPAPKNVEIFYKPPTTLQDPGGPIEMPPDSRDVHYEAEFVIVMGQRAKGVSVEAAPDHILGYTCGNDVSERQWQNGSLDGPETKDTQWWRGKGCDTFGPMGPAIAVGLDWEKSRIELRLNGEVRQSQMVSDLVFGPYEIVSFVSQHVTLEQGDVIFTGTPGSTKPMKDGDSVEVEITGIGVLRNPVVQT